MKKTIRVLLADDHVMVRDGLAAILRQQDDISVVGTAADGQEALELAKRTRPDVALIDIVMPGLNGIDVTTQIQEECPSIRIIIMSVHSDIDYVYRALKAGAQGYVAKTAAAADLIEAVRAAVAGRRFLSPRIAESVLDDYIRARASKSPLEYLSPRERQILQMIAEGRSSTSIGNTLSLSPKTIDTYRSRMMEKLGITELPALIKFAIQHGLTPPE
jgi:DNA-binding NarL/FixJ family response regulator